MPVLMTQFYADHELSVHTCEEQLKNDAQFSLEHLHGTVLMHPLLLNYG